MLRAGAHQQGRVDQGGGPAPHRLHQGPRRGLLEIAPKSRRCVRTMRIIKISLSFFFFFYYCNIDEGMETGRRRSTYAGGRDVLCRAAAVREELPAAVDQLPPPGPQARQLHRGGRRAHHQVPRALRQQVIISCLCFPAAAKKMEHFKQRTVSDRVSPTQVVAHRRETAGQDGQRDQELLEHAHQAEAPGSGHGPADPPPSRRRLWRARGAAALPAGATDAGSRGRRWHGGPSAPPPPPPAAAPGSAAAGRHLQLAGGRLHEP